MKNGLLILSCLVAMSCSAPGSDTAASNAVAQSTPVVSAAPAEPRPTRTPRPPRWNVPAVMGQSKETIDTLLGAAMFEPAEEGETYWYSDREWLLTYEEDRVVRARLYPENFLDPQTLRELGIDSGPPDQDTPYIRQWRSLPNELRVSIIGYQDDGYGVTGQWQVEYIDIRYEPTE